jgi:DNA polymerase V
VDVWLTTNRFNPEDPQYSAGTVVSLEEPTDYLPDLVAAARRGLARIFRDGYRYRKVAVFLSGIQDRNGRQADLFRTADPRKAALAEAVDRITSRYGNGSVVCAASSPTGEWGMRREWLSPGYSTRWDQVPSAKIR